MILERRVRYCDVCGKEIEDKEIVIERETNKNEKLAPIKTQIYIKTYNPKTQESGDICLACLGKDEIAPMKFIRFEEDFKKFLLKAVKK